MAHKAEHAIDLDTGAIVGVKVPGEIIATECVNSVSRASGDEQRWERRRRER
jgi:hypothetical protein